MADGLEDAGTALECLAGTGGVTLTREGSAEHAVHLAEQFEGRFVMPAECGDDVVGGGVGIAEECASLGPEEEEQGREFAILHELREFQGSSRDIGRSLERRSPHH